MGKCNGATVFTKWCVPMPEIDAHFIRARARAQRFHDLLFTPEEMLAALAALKAANARAERAEAAQDLLAGASWHDESCPLHIFEDDHLDKDPRCQCGLTEAREAHEAAVAARGEQK